MRSRWLRPFSGVWQSKRFLRVLGVIFAGTAWWTWESGEPGTFPSLRDVFIEMWYLACKQVLFEDVLHSLFRVFVGVGLALIAAIILGILPSLSRPLGFMIAGVLEVLRPVPPIAWTPVVILWFGVGDPPAFAIVMLGAFFPIWLGVQQGVGEIRQEHIWAARSLGASRRMLFVHILLPSALPYFLHGLRVGIGVAWFCVVAAEMMGVHQGLGQALQLFSLNLQMAQVFGYILVIGILGMLMTEALLVVENRLVAWHHRMRSFDG